jgi:hypothetical protein
MNEVKYSALSQQSHDRMRSVVTEAVQRLLPQLASEQQTALIDSQTEFFTASSQQQLARSETMQQLMRSTCEQYAASQQLDAAALLRDFKDEMKLCAAQVIMSDGLPQLMPKPPRTLLR